MYPVRLAFAALLCAGAVTVARAQPGFPRATPTPLAVVVLNGIDDPVVVAELKLKDDQLKALVARRQEVWDDGYNLNAAQFSEGAKARHEASDALFKKVLTAEQYKRAVQLGAQSVLAQRSFDPREGGPGTGPLAPRVTQLVLVRYPQIADALNLTEEQKKALAVGWGVPFGPSQLTDAQQTALKEFLGPIAKRWGVKTDPRIVTNFTAPGGFALLAAKDVRAELKLTGADDRALAELAQQWGAVSTGRRTREISPKEQAERHKELVARSEAALKGLTADQRKRLEQLAFQFAADQPRGVGFTGWEYVPFARTHIEDRYQEPAVATALGLTDEQRKAFTAALAAFETEAAAVLVAATDYDATQKKLDALVTARRDKTAALLTPTQAAKWKEMVGAPFGGLAQPDPAPPASDAVLLLAVGRSDLFANGLDLTSEQKEKLSAARAAYQKGLRVGREPGGFGSEFDSRGESGWGRGGFAQSPEQYAAQSAAQVAFDRAVADLLTAAQKTRLKQLALQQRAADSLFAALTETTELAVTDEQADRLFELSNSAVSLQQLRSRFQRPNGDGPLADETGQKMRDAADERMLKVLTDAQRAKWKELTGEPLKGLMKSLEPLYRSRGGFGRGGFEPPGGFYP